MAQAPVREQLHFMYHRQFLAIMQSEPEHLLRFKHAEDLPPGEIRKFR